MLKDRITVLVLAAAMAAYGCAPRQFTTVTLYDTPNAFVRLEADRTVEPDRGHSHPVTMTDDAIAAVLHGVVIEEPLTRLPLYDDTSLPRRHRAFDEHTIGFFAPLLSIALSQATPEEVVTFYHSRDVSSTSREVTSGGIFVNGEEFHLVLGNYRSRTLYMSDYGAADTTDDRLTPMKALAPQRGRLAFEPASATIVPARTFMDALVRPEARELIIRYKTLPSAPPAPEPVSPPPPPSK